MVSADAFKIWLAEAKVGDELVYYIGNLAEDSDPAKGPRAKALLELIDDVLYAKFKGRVSLRQEPLPVKGAAQHIARRAS